MKSIFEQNGGNCPRVGGYPISDLSLPDVPTRLILSGKLFLLYPYRQIVQWGVCGAAAFFAAKVLVRQFVPARNKIIAFVQKQFRNPFIFLLCLVGHMAGKAAVVFFLLSLSLIFHVFEENDHTTFATILRINMNTPEESKAVTWLKSRDRKEYPSQQSKKQAEKKKTEQRKEQNQTRSFGDIPICSSCMAA